MKYYKLTDQNMQTHHGFQWEVGVWVEATGDPEQGLCSDGYLHCYDSLLLAVLHNPIHASIKDPLAWEVEVGGKSLENHGLKYGFRKMRLMEELPVPVITLEHRVRYAILCALYVIFYFAAPVFKAAMWIVGVCWLLPKLGRGILSIYLQTPEK